MIICYLLACLPFAIGGAFWLKSKQINWKEWLIASGAAFLTTGIIHAITLLGMTADTETWSGKLNVAVHHPEWVEKYIDEETYEESYTDSKGKRHTRTKTRKVTKYRTHHECWTATDDFGDHDISPALFQEIAGNFGGIVTETPHKSGFYSGDRNIYVARNTTGYVYPTTTWRMFENRVKAAPSLFSYAPVPEGTPIVPYPENGDFMHSDRLTGTARSHFSTREWDLMNSRLGPVKKVNVIAVAFYNQDSMLGQYQEASWVGGRKNDVVICYNVDANKKVTWAHVFGWTEKDIAKRNLESLFMTNVPSDALIPEIEKVISKDYVIKDWSKFDYISVEPPTWAYIMVIVVMVAVQVGIWLWAFKNQEDKSIGEENILQRLSK